jgi:mRNA-degrading endonuclease toxin of MazEF toxin-antitoxin module
MTPPGFEHPRRGQVYLASVPFASQGTELQPTRAPGGVDSPGDSPGFVAEIRFKLRPVLVVQNNEITDQPGYDYILAAPIYSVRQKHKTRPAFERLVENRLAQIYYLDRRTQGVTRPSYVALAQIQLLHRSVFKEFRGALAASEMRQIDERLRFCLDL